MAGNRVDELEETVRELRATVNGLTDELVETKERLRIVEDEVEPDMDPGIIEGGPTASDVNVNADADPPAESDGGTDDPAPTADDGKGEDLEGEDTTDGQEDDIIVA